MSRCIALLMIFASVSLVADQGQSDKEGKEERAFQAYQEFIKNYPRSKYVDDAKSNMVALADRLYRQGKREYKFHISEGEGPVCSESNWGSMGQMDEESVLPALVDILNSVKTQRIKEKTLFWIGQIGSPEAEKALIKIAKQDQDPEIKKKAIFWLGQRGGKGIVDVLRNIYNTTKNRDVKEKVIFSIGQREEEAISFLIKVAKKERDFKLRKKAIFWLAQSEDPRARKALMEILEGR